MPSISPLPLLVALLLAIATAMVLIKAFGAPALAGRFAAIDGLRGYLAFFVFVHHSCIWYFYLRTGTWDIPPSSKLYIHLGQVGVALFFMITGFLFFSKLLYEGDRPIDWLSLYVSRVLRLVPLYAVAMLARFAIVIWVSDGDLTHRLTSLRSGMVGWLCFTIPGTSDQNCIKGTGIVIAGVTWSLTYEWFFYLCLPLMAPLLGVRVPKTVIVLAILSMAIMLSVWSPSLIHLWTFVGGMIAAVLQRLPSFKDFARRRAASLLVIACVLAEVIFFPKADGLAQVALLSLAFCLVACGSDLFGALTSAASRMLGEFAYSIYLLHGMVLFVIFSSLVGIQRSAELSLLEHWIVVVGVAPVLIVLSFAAFVFIERPAIRVTPSVTQWLRKRGTSFFQRHKFFMLR